MAMIRFWQDALLYLVLVIVIVLSGWQALDYFHFRHLGARFTASNGNELCEAQRRIAEHVGFPGELPDCDYVTRNQR